MYKVVYDKRVSQIDIPRLDFEVQKDIKRVIEKKLLEHPLVYSVPLRQELKGFRKLRISDYRVIFKISDELIAIFAIGHRKGIYKIAKKRVN